MKYLEDTKLQIINKLFHSVQCGDRIITGRVDAFTCKRGADDKKLAHTLNLKFEEEELVGGAFQKKKPVTSNENFTDCGRRRLLTDLILTLNASFPDYDFSEVRPHHFEKINAADAIANINERLNEMSTHHSSTYKKTSGSFLQILWTSLDEVIILNECEVYSFLLPADGIDDNDYQFLIPDENDEYSEDRHHMLWSFNYFFYNRSMKRIVFFTCTESSLLAAPCGHDEIVGQYVTPKNSGDEDILDSSGDALFGLNDYHNDDPDELYGFDMDDNDGQNDTPDLVV